MILIHLILEERQSVQRDEVGVGHTLSANVALRVEPEVCVPVSPGLLTNFGFVNTVALSRIILRRICCRINLHRGDSWSATLSLFTLEISRARGLCLLNIGNSLWIVALERILNTIDGVGLPAHKDWGAYVSSCDSCFGPSCTAEACSSACLGRLIGSTCR
jgi:hypothetical protein